MTYRAMFVRSGRMLAGLVLAGLYAASALAAPHHFSDHSQAALDRLGKLNELEVRDWEYREGEIANGESRDLDTTAWKRVTIPFLGSRDEVWLRRWIEIPKTLHGYDISGTLVSFAIEVGRDGPGRGYLPEAIYFNGERVAEGTHLDSQVLAKQAVPGTRVLVAVHMPATADQKHFGRINVKIHFRADRPDPEQLRTEIISAALVLPTLTSDPSALDAQEQIVDAAARELDISALDRNDQQSFDASLRKAQAMLEPLRPMLKECLVRLVNNAHIDAAWLWTSSETVDQVHFTFANALQLMKEYPDYVFSQSSAQFYEWMEEKFPELFADIQKRVREGRWELVGGMWVEPDLNMPDGEAQVRQLLIGTRYFRSKFNKDIKVGWNPDSFGFNWQLPQIYKKSGIDYFLTQKLHYNETNQLPLRLFWWQAPDGSRVLTYFPHDYVQEVDPISIGQDVSRMAVHNPGQTGFMHLYGPSLGRLAISPARENLDAAKLWSAQESIFPAMKFSTAQDFFDDMKSRIGPAKSPVWNYSTFARNDTQLPVAAPGKISLPVWNDEMYLELHRGTYTSQAGEKANIRHSEEQLLNAEKFASLGWLEGLDYPGSRFTEAWKRKSFNDFHDVAAGSSVAAVYKDARKDYDMVRSFSRETTDAAKSAIESHIDTSAIAGVPVIVWNPLSWSRTDVVSLEVQMPHALSGAISVLDEAGTPVLSQVLSVDRRTNTYQLLLRPANVPSIGYKVLHATASARKAASDLVVRDTTLENNALRVVVDSKTGCITSLYNKLSRFESIAANQCGNMLQAFVDDAPVEDAWNIPSGFDRSMTALTTADSVEVIEKGPLRADVRITRTWSKSKFIQDIILYAGIARVDVATTVDWHETRVLLKASFPLAIKSNFATCEIPFGSIERPTTRNNSVEKAKFEVPALRWADLGDSQNGFSLINEAKYGYDTKGSELRLSLLRSPTYPDPNADRGLQSFSYSLYPHANSWKKADTVLRGYEFNYRLTAHQVAAHAGELPGTHSFVSVAPANLVLTAMKKSEDSDSLTLRFYEWAGKATTARITVPPGASAAIETNLMEKIVSGNSAHFLPSKKDIEMSVGPYSINTLRVDYPRRPKDGSQQFTVGGRIH